MQPNVYKSAEGSRTYQFRPILFITDTKSFTGGQRLKLIKNSFKYEATAFFNSLAIATTAE